MAIKIGKYTFANRDKLSRAKRIVGEGADEDKLLEEYLKMGGLAFKSGKEKDQLVKLEYKKKEEKKAPAKAKPKKAKKGKK